MFENNAEADSAPSRRVRWAITYRLIPSRYPPIHLFERIAPPEDWDALIELEALTNPRIRQDTGTISLVPKARRVSGPGASIVMAPFTHASTKKPTRFSAGKYGIYYAAHSFNTALREVAFHMQRFYASTNAPATDEDFRCYKGRIDKTMHDIRAGSWGHLLDPDPSTYPIPQAFAERLRVAGSNGIVYPSVRDKGGECLAAFWPDVVEIPVQERHISMRWNGAIISEWFDYGDQTSTWNEV